MRKWRLLACGIALQSVVFLACSGGDELEAPMIGDCTGCSPALAGGNGSPLPDSSVFDAGNDVTLEGSVVADGGPFVDVGVSGNDVFGDTFGFVDVGVSGNDVFPP